MFSISHELLSWYHGLMEHQSINHFISSYIIQKPEGQQINCSMTWIYQYNLKYDTIIWLTRSMMFSFCAWQSKIFWTICKCRLQRASLFWSPQGPTGREDRGDREGTPTIPRCSWRWPGTDLLADTGNLLLSHLELGMTGENEPCPRFVRQDREHSLGWWPCSSLPASPECCSYLAAATSEW